MSKFLTINETSLTFSNDDKSIRISAVGINENLNITFYENDVAHVSYVKNLEPVESLFVTEKMNICEPDIKASQDGKGIELACNNLILKIDTNLCIDFCDKTGKKILSETGREFCITHNAQIIAYNIRESFEGPENEVLYGLGQYQNGIMNWKNVPIRMEQSNQEIVIPTLISTAGYGILWDNYSQTTFNKPDINIPMISLDKTNQISQGKFKATKDGQYAFYVNANGEEIARRQDGKVVLKVDGQEIIHYDTMWIPRYHTGIINLEAGKEYDITLENPQSPVDGQVYVCPPDYGRTQFDSLMANSIEFYFFAGDTTDDLISKYRSLTGKAAMLSKPAYGFWQCREKYSTQEELLENARELRERNIPCDIIVQDWHYWGEEGKGPVWDKNNYPTPEKMTSELSKMNMQLIASVWPRFKYPKMYNDFSLRGWMLEDGDYYYDVFNENARLLFWDYLKAGIYDNGLAGVWSDGTEPDPDLAITDKRCSLGAFDQYRMAYSLMHSKTIYDCHRRDFSDKRVLNLTRSSSAGIQTYGAIVWSGDVSGDWDSFAKQITAGLNYSISGTPYWTTDIGGFFRDKLSTYQEQYQSEPFNELLIRWFQFGVFCPIFRLHGYQSQTEIWRFLRKTYAICKEHIELRYKLLPYIYSTAWDVYKHDSTMMRPLAMDFASDEDCLAIRDEYMFGKSLLVCPIIEAGAKIRKVYLPKGSDWYDFNTGQRYSGGMVIEAPAPLDTIPVFVKAGSIVPIGAPVQYALEQNGKPIDIAIYPGADAQFSLFEDDGISYSYENGKYCTVDFSWNDIAQSLTIDNRKGNFDDMAASYSFNIKAGSKAQNINYTGQKIEISFVD